MHPKPASNVKDSSCGGTFIEYVLKSTAQSERLFKLCRTSFRKETYRLLVARRVVWLRRLLRRVVTGVGGRLLISTLHIQVTDVMIHSPKDVKRTAY